MPRHREPGNRGGIAPGGHQSRASVTPVISGRRRLGQRYGQKARSQAGTPAADRRRVNRHHAQRNSAQQSV